MNRLLIIFFAITAASPFAWRHFHKPAVTKKTTVTGTATKKKDAKTTAIARLVPFADKLEQYAKENGYNDRYCFLVDMKIASGSNRFFVYDIQKDSVLQSGLVAHGYGNSNDENITFSNVPGSNSSSIGKYKIGNAYHGKFGLAYKLHGLDKTNNNAFDRFVVLHAHECVPDSEIAPESLCMSQGCPTVAPSFLKRLATYLDDSDKPVLLWIFN
ncbi:MAG: murein L,D-transpeptidase catalytic domain family protein [Bacteroidota bacterium]